MEDLVELWIARSRDCNDGEEGHGNLVVSGLKFVQLGGPWRRSAGSSQFPRRKVQS